MAWIAAHRARQAAEQAAEQTAPREHRVTMSEDPAEVPGPDFSLEDVRREGLIAPAGAEPAPHDGTGRVRLKFAVHDTSGSVADREVRVPPGVSVFDSASWNGIAIDSTCGGHGTCHKCKVRLSSSLTGHAARRAHLHARPSSTQGWRLACLVQATRDLEVEVPPLTTRPKAATVGVGRQVILRPAVQKRYVELEEPTLSDQRPTWSGCSTPSTTSSRCPTSTRCAGCRRCSGRRTSRSPRSSSTRRSIDVEPGDTTDEPLRASRSTSARRPWSRPCSTSRPAPPSRWPRCSTSSSRSAAT